MNQKYEQLYRDMLTDVERAIKTDLKESENIASCFWITRNYWEHLKQLIRETPFANDAEEIDFFRNVKPTFTSQVQFYYTLSERLLFVPSSMEEQTEYWIKETEKYKAFYNKNETFIHYYESGSVYLNELYFKKVKEELKSLVKTEFYDNDLSFCSSHDYLVRELLANKMYYEYVRKKIDETLGQVSRNERDGHSDKAKPEVNSQ